MASGGRDRGWRGMIGRGGRLGGVVVLGGWARREGGLSGDVWVMGGVMGLKLLWCEFRRVGYGMVWYGGVGYGVFYRTG